MRDRFDEWIVTIGGGTGGHGYGIAHGLTLQGWIALAQHDYARARAHLEEGLELDRQLEHTGSYSAKGKLLGLGHAAWAEGDSASATAWYTKSLRGFEALGNTDGIAAWLAGLAGIAGAAQELARASGASTQRAAQPGSVSRAHEIRSSLQPAHIISGPVPPCARPPGLQRRWLSSPTMSASFLRRAQLGVSTFETAWAEGQAMTLKRAIAYALGEPDG